MAKKGGKRGKGWKFVPVEELLLQGRMPDGSRARFRRNRPSCMRAFPYQIRSIFRVMKRLESRVISARRNHDSLALLDASFLLNMRRADLINLRIDYFKALLKDRVSINSEFGFGLKASRIKAAIARQLEELDRVNGELASLERQSRLKIGKNG